MGCFRASRMRQLYTRRVGAKFGYCGVLLYLCWQDYPCAIRWGICRIDEE